MVLDGDQVLRMRVSPRDGPSACPVRPVRACVNPQQQQPHPGRHSLATPPREAQSRDRRPSHCVILVQELFAALIMKAVPVVDSGKIKERPIEYAPDTHRTMRCVTQSTVPCVIRHIRHAGE